MPTFRAYLLDSKGKIKWGEWFEAADLEDAKAQAHALCRPDVPTVELWLGDRPAAVVECSEEPG